MNKREEEKLKKQQERLEKEIARTKAMSKKAVRKKA